MVVIIRVFLQAPDNAAAVRFRWDEGSHCQTVRIDQPYVGEVLDMVRPDLNDFRRVVLVMPSGFEQTFVAQV